MMSKSSPSSAEQEASKRKRGGARTGGQRRPSAGATRNTGNSAKRADGEPARQLGADQARSDRAIGVGPLQDQIGYALRRAQLAVFADIIAALAEFDLSPAKYSVLAVIHENAGARSSDVGRALEIRKTNFAPLLDALEQRELVVRRPSQEDRRTFALYLTAKGRALLERATRAQARHEARFVARIGKAGRVQLLELLNRLTKVSEKTVRGDGYPEQDKKRRAASRPARKGKR